MSSRSSAAERAPTRGRRGARRLAMQALYQWLVAGGEPRSLAAEFLEDRAKTLDTEYFRLLLAGCIENAEALNALLAPLLDRAPTALDPVEHAILLIGAEELRARPQLAVSIVIDEAVELAKAFGAEGGHRYVNGVLDHLAQTLRAQDRAGRGSRARG